jgi:hypothetical protein
MFVGFALLNTTRGKDAENNDFAFARTSKPGIVDNGRHSISQVPADLAEQRTAASSILWQFVSGIIKAVADALNDPSLIDYAKQQGLDPSDALTGTCHNFATEATTASKPSPMQVPAAYSITSKDSRNKIAPNR